VRLSSNVSDVEVRLDGEHIATLPIATELTLAPGRRQLELTRTGYVPVRRALDLAPGADTALSFRLVPSSEGLAQGGTLATSISEDNAVISVDGRPLPPAARSVRLPLGRHSVLIQRAGFFDVEREVNVAPGANSLHVSLIPTPGYLADYVAGARRTRTYAFIAGALGGVALSGSAGYLLWNQGKKNDAKRDFDSFTRDIMSQGGACEDETCTQKLGVLLRDLDAKRKRDVYGWVGIAAGAAALGTGLCLYVLGDDPSRYEPGPKSDIFSAVTLNVAPGSVTVSSAF
jgi:hypothetical protein